MPDNTPEWPTTPSEWAVCIIFGLVAASLMFVMGGM